MSTLTLTSIQVTADYAVKLPAAPHQVLARAGQATEILNRPTTPFAFNLPNPYPVNYAYGINVTGRITISNAELPLWNTVGATYRIKAGTDLAHPVMQSDALPTGNITDHTLNVAANAFHLIQVPQTLLPFKFVETWVWSVALETGNIQHATLSNAITTQMKAYFLLGAPPTTIGQAYPSELLDFFIPLFPMLPQAALNLPDSLKWWARSVVAKVFDHGNANLRYGNRSGENNSYYVGKASNETIPFADVGTFLFSDWVNRTYPTCNCTDLAYAVSAGLQALGTSNAAGILRLPHVITWVDRFGYVGPGPLFGYISSDEELRCNNPFWLPDSRPNVPNMDLKRTPFLYHTWVEVDFGIAGENNMVLDPTHGRYNTATNSYQLTDGTETRQQWRINSRTDGPTEVPYLDQNKFFPIAPIRLQGFGQ